MDSITRPPDISGEIHASEAKVPGEDNEKVPIKPPLKVLDSRTISKKFGWWAAVVLLESYAKKQVCFYLWQKKGEEWKRKQKFGVHSREDWASIKNAVESFIQQMP